MRPLLFFYRIVVVSLSIVSKEVGMSQRSWIWTSVFLATSLFLAACGGGSEEPTPTTEPTAPPAPTATATSLPPTPTVAPEPQQLESPLANPESPLASPESPLGAPQPESPLAAAAAPVHGSGCDLDFPAPADGTAVICGGVVSETPATKYLLAGDFYLAPVIYTKATLDDGKEIDVPFVSLNVGADKVADIKTEEGGFVFLNVPPGEYSVVIYTPIQSFLFHDGTGQNTLMFKVEAGETKHLDSLSLE